MSQGRRPRVVFTPAGIRGEVQSGTTVLDAARQLGVDLDTVCGGRAICGHCQIVATPGTFAKWAIDADTDALTPPGAAERDARTARALAPGHRLGCLARIVGDAVIDVPPASQVHRQVVRKELELDSVAIDPRFTLVFDGETTVAMGGGAVVAIWPGFVETAFGIAVDVGSTTLAAHLCDLSTGEGLATATAMNPQIRFGEDLMSRVSYVMMNAGGADELTAAVRGALAGLVDELLTVANVAREHVLDIVLVGNPIMHHLVLGFDPIPLGQAPFTLATAGPVGGAAAELGLDLPNASFYFAPCIAGHVGADTVAAILAEGPHRSARPQLLVDIGTNAEIVLGDRNGLFAASSPTGPAFEGAQISCGRRATAGAIERVRIDRDSWRARVKVIGSDLWSDEAGFDDALPTTGVTGICGSGIVEVIGEMFLAGIIDANGVIQPPRGSDAPVVADGRTYAYVVHERGDTRLAITQNDVRAIQLAKAALRAGIDLLVERARDAARPELADVHDIRLAGAFGARIDPVYAMVLGLVPDVPVDGVRAVGNAAGAGAVRALLSTEARAEMERVAAAVTKVETATEPRFQELFVAAMAFPHATATTTHLERAIELPARELAPARRRRERSRR